MAVLVACTPAEAVRGGGGVGKGGQTAGVVSPSGVYLASMIVGDVNTEFGFVAVLAPQITDFPAGEIGFFVLNKWTGLSPGTYREQVKVWGARAGPPLFEFGTEFRVEAGDLATTLAEPVYLEDLKPGIYAIAVELNGVEVVRYPFRVYTGTDE